MNSVFEANPEVEKLIVFEDGNCFLMQDKQFADLYKKQSGIDYKIVSRQEEKPIETKSKKSK